MNTQKASPVVAGLQELRESIAQLQAYRFKTQTLGQAIQQWFHPPMEEGMTVISRDATLAVIDAESQRDRAQQAVAKASPDAPLPQVDGEAISDAAVANAVLVDRGALTLALNVLRRAGKDEVADALAAAARSAS